MSENQIMGDDIPLQPTVDQLNYHDTPDLITDIKLEPPDCEGTKIEFVDASQILPETQTVPVLSSSDASNDLKLEIKLEPQETIVKPEEIDIKAEISEGLKSLIKTENEETELNVDMESEYSSAIKCEDSMDVPDERTISSDLGIEDFVKTGQIELCRKYGDNTAKQILSCPDCQYQTLKKKNFNQHMYIHRRQLVNWFKCNECDYQTLYKSSLIKHVLVHQDPEKLTKYKCGQCNYTTIRKSNFDAHLARHKNPGKIKTKMLRCKECDYQSVDSMSIRRHIQKLHMDTYTGNIFKCTLCEYETIIKSELNRHMLTHGDKSYECDKCEFKAKLKSNLFQHMRRHKTPDEAKMLRCSECDFQALFKSKLTTHMLVHQDLNQLTKYKCDHCGYKTIRKENLNKHIRLHTTPKEVKMLRCEECDYQATSYKRIKRHIGKFHMQTYTGGTFKCTHCDYVTVLRCDLNRHLLKHEDKSYQCDHCDFKAKLKPSLILHMRRLKYLKK